MGIVSLGLIWDGLHTIETALDEGHVQHEMTCMGNCWLSYLNFVMWTEEMKDQWNWEILNGFVKKEYCTFQLKEIITECKQMLLRRTKVGVPLQVIAASVKWCPTLERFLQHISQNFVVCISSCLEATVFAKLQPSLHYLSASSKPQAVLGELSYL